MTNNKNVGNNTSTNNKFNVTPTGRMPNNNKPNKKNQIKDILPPKNIILFLDATKAKAAKFKHLLSQTVYIYLLRELVFRFLFNKVLAWYSFKS